MRYSLVVLLLFVFSNTVLAQTTVPHTFVAGTAAKASEVNANFQALTTAINAGIIGYEIIRQTYTAAPQPAGYVPAPTYTANCSAGKRVLGGGFWGQALGAPGINGGVPAVIAMGSQPGAAAGDPQGTRWEVQIFNNTNASQTIVVTAICANVVP